ncbi:tumor necrosis factor receptor superfamily member 5 isoform X2 [Chelmon rostratus]|uniref:tumor necrosis factor receptor superfamily member 5 isoform X2 n=1 Tax=Chelmon rostratus TaxID=109905 RepID=UPI001BE7E595|nr:tumor necrosis factor receptor superfamily member 5 isoform X2 [Chelmon rostratus]
MRPLRLRMTITMMVMMMMMMWAFTSLAAAQCDPQTQYARGGECCKMCGPGTSMSSLGTCLEPQCQECRENEYQDKYTRESKCQLQPYCDRNTNFQAADHDTKKRTTCICKVGFHCSGEECMICVPHSTCGPGHGVHSKGNHTHDTVCQNCPDGTYSDEDSLDGICKKWTECEKGQHIQHIGTDVSDAICETSRTHLTVILAVLFAVFVVFTAGFMFWRCKDKQDNAKGKGCVESCLGETHEPLKEATGLITTPTEPVDEEYCTSGSMPESSQDEGFQRTPEENEDEPSQEMSHDVLLTENGKIVTQENGKAEVLSRQESQTQTITG